MSTTARPFTYEDYLLLPEDRRYEILDGELFMTPSPRPYHQIVSSNIHLALQLFAREHRLGTVIAAPCDVVLTETDVVQPDILFVAAARASTIGEKFITAAPDLVVEILSPGTAQRDQTLKAKIYQRYGVKELWIVSPEARTIEVFANSDSGFRRAAIYGYGDTLASPLLQGLAIPLDKVF